MRAPATPCATLTTISQQGDVRRHQHRHARGEAPHHYFRRDASYTIGVNGLKFFGQLFFLIATFYCDLSISLHRRRARNYRADRRLSIFSAISPSIKDELLIVLGTSTSGKRVAAIDGEARKAGLFRNRSSGFVVPTGYSFNLDGTNIYMTLAALFIAQARASTSTLSQQLTILVVAMLTSKGASGRDGGGLHYAGGRLAVVTPALVPGMAMVPGVDKFMSGRFR